MKTLNFEKPEPIIKPVDFIETPSYERISFNGQYYHVKT